MSCFIFAGIFQLLGYTCESPEAVLKNASLWRFLHLTYPESSVLGEMKCFRCNWTTPHGSNSSIPHHLVAEKSLKTCSQYLYSLLFCPSSSSPSYTGSWLRLTCQEVGIVFKVRALSVLCWTLWEDRCGGKESLSRKVMLYLWKDFLNGTGEKAQLVKCLSCKPSGIQVLIPGTHFMKAVCAGTHLQRQHS